MVPETRRTAHPDPAMPGLRAAVSAPGKCILLGEHAVVYGEPCLSVAIDLRTQIVAHRVGDKFRVNGYPLSKRHHAYMVSALEEVWPSEDAVRFEVSSDLPSASGTGSSAALSVATVAALERLSGSWDLERVATAAFRAERRTQEAGSPNDTSVSSAGGAVLLSPERQREKGLRHLWSVTHDDLVWEVHGMDVPRLGLVIGQSGVRARTATQVQKVRRFVDKSVFGRDTVRAIGRLVWEALDAIHAEDLDTLGRLMERCQGHLHTMGVNHPRLQALIDAARAAPGTLGAKITGAGGGGAIVVLTADTAAAARAIEAAGGSPHIVHASNEGVRPELALEATTEGSDAVAVEGPEVPGGAP